MLISDPDFTRTQLPFVHTNAKDGTTLTGHIKVYWCIQGAHESCTSPDVLHNAPWWDFAMYLDAPYRAGHWGRLCLRANLVPRTDGTWETHCGDLARKLRGKGLGLVMYQQIIAFARQQGYSAGSSSCAALPARTVWKRVAHLDAGCVFVPMHPGAEFLGRWMVS